MPAGVRTGRRHLQIPPALCVTGTVSLNGRYRFVFFAVNAQNLLNKFAIFIRYTPGGIPTVQSLTSLFACFPIENGTL